MNIAPDNIKVALLAGGTSGERQISLESGKGAGAALRTAGFDVREFDPAIKEDLIALIEGDFDVAFLCLHGKGGEDGSMQGMLQVLGIPYTGPGVWSSATAMDKAKAKIHYEAQGIPTPPSLTLFDEASLDVEAVLADIGAKVVVKPATEGSALGVRICASAEEVVAAVKEAFSMDDEVIIESFVSGTELTVAVLGNDVPEALPVIQIVPQLGEFYDYESKYAPGGSKHICPAPLSDELTAAAQSCAMAAHRALGCTGVSRTDMIVDEQGKVWVLETNTNPGMTETSLLPDAGRAAGMSFPELCTRLVELALETE
ncbi:D-alanine--D-alanine ligase family protein [Curtanaerobium respiraculi]|uniref:D-alanine--D-alanine ligase family protein n=1 Tax=Curtanaerobium respiraculi TaxID=2949669 RepID=UPI0024B3A6FC|nr:D-alanine--D-alanine ligase [Curtanaerobium respiraculi]